MIEHRAEGLPSAAYLIRWVRVWSPAALLRWCRRHSVVAGLLVAGFGMVVCGAGVAAADDGTGGESGGAGGRPEADSAGAFAGIGIRVPHRGERCREEERGADPLQQPRGDENAERGGGATRHGGGGEDGEAGDEESADAEPVTEPAAGEEKSGEDEGVGVDDPFEAVDAGVERGLDAAEREKFLSLFA